MDCELKKPADGVRTDVRTFIKVKQSVGAATLLIHMLAKHDTHIKANKTTDGLVPARLRTRVMRMRSILVLLNADDIVNPPMRSMIVGENIAEKMNLNRKISTFEIG